jgi:hypothetical protein
MPASLAAEADFAHHTVGPDTHKKKKDNYIGRFSMSHEVLSHGFIIFCLFQAKSNYTLTSSSLSMTFLPTLLLN